MKEALSFRQVTKEELDQYKDLILPMIYGEMSENDEEGYLAIAAWADDKPVGVLVSDLLDNGDITLLNVWTDRAYRRQGVATALLQKMTRVAVELYEWDEGQYGDDITLSVMYSLRDDYKKPFEEWLMKNDFTDFAVLKRKEGEPDICTAMAEIHFFRAE